MCLFLCQYHDVFISTTLKCNLKVEIIMPPAELFFFKIDFVIQHLLWFCINLRMVFSSSVKNTGGILISIH